MADDIFIIQDDGELVEMNEHAYDSEALLQELLAKYPKLLAGGQMDASSPRRWMLVRREMGIPSKDKGANRWSVDHLFLDQDAIPTLVEVKRSTDTRLRREVVGQMLDYAANAVVYWPVEHIRAEFEKGSEDANDELLDEDCDPEEFWQKVKTNLQAGKIRMVFVADVIPPELRRIVEFLNEQMDPAEVLAVEIKQFVGKEMKTLVPRVIGQTAEAERKKKGIKGKWSDWDEALADVPNSAIVSYFKQQLEEKREGHPHSGTLFYHVNGQRRWFLRLRVGGFAYAKQYRRFDGDIAFWRDGLSQPDYVQPMMHGEQLRFRLYSEKDLVFFREAVTGRLQSVKWQESAVKEDDEEDNSGDTIHNY